MNGTDLRQEPACETWSDDEIIRFDRVVAAAISIAMRTSLSGRKMTCEDFVGKIREDVDRYAPDVARRLVVVWMHGETVAVSRYRRIGLVLSRQGDVEGDLPGNGDPTYVYESIPAAAKIYLIDITSIGDGWIAGKVILKGYKPLG